MSLFQVNKPKSAAKLMVPPSTTLQNSVLETLRHMAGMVGATLGPGGKQVLIERSEIGMKPIMTKDGVTVIKNLGYDDAIQQLILEAARDAAVRTASEAGDGTTTATILAESICSSTAAAVKDNPKISPQKIVREMQALVPWIEGQINLYAIDMEHDTEGLLRRVATLSANGDKDLAEVIIEAFNTVGDEGNLTILEAGGPSKYEVTRISGYTVEKGYEESCKNFANGFINDKSGTMVVLDKPIVLLFDGVITDISQIIEAINKLGQFFLEQKTQHNGVVLVAHGFSESVLGDLHLNWNHASSTIKVFPMLTPESATLNYRTEFLYDLQAYTGFPVYNPIDRPLVEVNPEFLFKNNPVKNFEAGRFKSSIIVDEDVDRVAIRVEELKLRREKPESQYEAHELDVRIGKLTSGIAKLVISGPSQGETREKRDRAEDAWMAIKGAIKFGAVPGGGFALVKLAADLVAKSDAIPEATPHRIAMEILSDALLKPVKVLYSNYGYNAEETDAQITKILHNEEQAFDIAEQKWVPKDELLDSLPAVLEAVRNSISIASLLGTLGGIVAFRRDNASDSEEQRFARKFERAIGENQV